MIENKKINKKIEELKTKHIEKDVSLTKREKFLISYHVDKILEDFYEFVLDGEEKP